MSYGFGQDFAELAEVIGKGRLDPRQGLELVNSYQGFDRSGLHLSERGHQGVLGPFGSALKQTSQRGVVHQGQVASQNQTRPLQYLQGRGNPSGRPASRHQIQQPGYVVVFCPVVVFRVL